MFSAKGIPEGEGAYELVRCGGCGHGWTEPPLPSGEVGRWYPSAYYGKENKRFHWCFEVLVRMFRRRRAAVIRRNVEPGPVLDVGCGRGLILGMLKTLGYVPYGVEISEHAAHQARARGLQVHIGDFRDAPYEREFFQAVTFWHSLEHVPDPMAALLRAHVLLRKGGLLVVAVPNSESLQAKWAGRDWFHLDIPRHYQHFALRSLRLALEKSGFRVAETAHFSFEQNPYGWLQSMLNVCGLRFNFLYNCLKSGEARQLSVRRHPGQALGILLLVPLLLPFAIALTVLEAFLQRGGTVEVYAVKQ